MSKTITQKKTENTLNILKNEAVVSSLDVSIIFEKQHKDILLKIRELINKLTAEEFSVKNYFIDGSYVSKNGRLYGRYIITKKGFDLLALSFTGKKTFKYKVWYIETFDKMSEKIADDIRQSIINQNDNLWLQKKESQIIRRELTDAIKKYVVDYREEVEHKTNDGRFYQRYTNLIYKILKVELPKGEKPRDVLDVEKIVKIENMEIKVANLIEEFAEQGLHYKKVYKKVKQELTVKQNKSKQNKGE